MNKFKEYMSEAKDMTRQYDGFFILNRETGKQGKYPYIKGKNHVDVEDAAIRDEMKRTGLERSNFTVYGFVQKGEY